MEFKTSTILDIGCNLIECQIAPDMALGDILKFYDRFPALPQKVIKALKNLKEPAIFGYSRIDGKPWWFISKVVPQRWLMKESGYSTEVRNYRGKLSWVANTSIIDTVAKVAHIQRMDEIRKVMES